MRIRTSVLLAGLALLLSERSVAESFWDRFELHGYAELQLRALGDEFDSENWYMSQWANVLDLELEADLAPDGFGPFDIVELFARVEVRYECVYTGCGIAPTHRWFGDRASVAPRNQTDAWTNPFRGNLPVATPRRVHDDHELLDITGAILPGLFDVVPEADVLPGVPGVQTGVDVTFAPLAGTGFAVKETQGSRGSTLFVLGPYRPETHIRPIGSLATVRNPTFGLPMRPEIGATPTPGWDTPAEGIYVPSAPLRAVEGDFNSFDQNNSEADLAWNHGYGQDERELKELYVDVELFEGRLWARVGKQTIVWGKTELFRTTDQFNAQDLALASLPSLEESRLANWSARGTWSFWDIGPLEDVRLELAANFDDFEPLDLGRCGEPYTIWLACGKTFGLFAHGFAGAGLAGEEQPPAPWNSWKGVEVGARVEFRVGRFSFQISDFYGYDDAPVLDTFHEYSRNVDVMTGRPLDVYGRPFVDPVADPDGASAQSAAFHSGNRQLFDVVCGITEGLGADALGGGGTPEPALVNRCLLDLPNTPDPVQAFVQLPDFFGTILAGNAVGEGNVGLLVSLSGAPNQPVRLLELNRNSATDGDRTGIGQFGNLGVSAYLTDEQEALLGCGPFYGSDCDVDGIDLFNAEASVLIQAFPMFELDPQGPVATRFVPGIGTVVLPGARAPGYTVPGHPEFGYDPAVDGDPSGLVFPDTTFTGQTIIHPLAGEPVSNELAAVSWNFMTLLAALGEAGSSDPDSTDPDCRVAQPELCSLVGAVMVIAGKRRPEVRSGGNGVEGRRDFIWHGGTEIRIRYQKRNVLGFAFDFAHDATSTNWGVEMTWFHDQPFGKSDEPRGWVLRDSYNLTISVDRPTFINFLNSGRTFFFNMQWFVRYIQGYERGNVFGVDGPFAALGTFSVFTGYFQDRLLPALTWVHDVRSASGGLIAQLTYRFSQDFSITIGTAGFYGGPGLNPQPLRAPLLPNAGPGYKSRTRWNGLSPIAERDEVFLRLRYTF